MKDGKENTLLRSDSWPKNTQKKVISPSLLLCKTLSLPLFINVFVHYSHTHTNTPTHTVPDRNTHKNKIYLVLWTSHLSEGALIDCLADCFTEPWRRIKRLYGLYSSLAPIQKVYDAVSTTLFVCLLVVCIHLCVCILYLSASVSCLCRRLSVLYCMCVGIYMEAFNVCCCVRAAANLCPLTETSMCAKWARMERGREREQTLCDDVIVPVE